MYVYIKVRRNSKDNKVYELQLMNPLAKFYIRNCLYVFTMHFHQHVKP